MLEYNIVQIQEPNFQDYFGADFEFDNRYGWHVAFGFSEYDNLDLTSLQPDPSYGKLAAYLIEWGHGDTEEE